MRKILCFVFVWTPLFVVLAQDSWRILNTTNTGENGLVSNYSLTLINDNNNTLWIGTTSGISAFDGTSWKTLAKSDGLASGEVEHLAMDKDNNLWISYESEAVGVSRYDGESFIHFREEDGLFNDKVNDILVDKLGNVWFAMGSFFSNAGISKFDGSNWTNFSTNEGLPNKAITALCEDSSGNIVIGTDGAGTYILQNGSITPFSPAVNSTDRISDVHLDSDGNIWVSTSNKIYKYSSDWEVVNPTEPGFGVVNEINSDSNGSIFFSTTGGFSILKDDIFTYYDTDDNLPHRRVYSSTTRENKIWIGTERGIAFYENSKWHQITTDNGGLINNNVNSIFEDSNDNLWFCTGDGISKYDGSNWLSFRSTNGKEIKPVYTGIQDKNGIFWFGIVGSILKYDGESWEVFDFETDNIFSGTIKDIVQDKSGNIWFAGGNYLLRYDEVDWTHYNESHGFVTQNLESLYEDKKGRIWIGSDSQISYYDGSQFTHYRNGVDFLTNSPVSAFFEDNNGLLHAVGANRVLTFETDHWDEHPTMGTWTYDGIIDSADQIWLTTLTEGLIKYQKDSKTEIDESDGLSSNLVNTIYRTENGVFYIGTAEGITEIIPDVQLGTPKITISDEENEIFDLEIESYGITKPYWFSLDGENFTQNDGIFTKVQTDSKELYATNAYDTVKISYSLTPPPIPITLEAKFKKNKISQIYPNPSSGIFHLELQNNLLGQVKVHDLSGRLVLNQTFQTSTIIDLSKKTKGVYLVKVIAEHSVEEFRIIRN